jgi:type I restriction enzyme S subunit
MSEDNKSDKYQSVKLKTLVIQHNSGVYKNSSLYGTGANIVGVSDLYRHNSVDGQEFRRVPLTNEELTLFSLNEGDLIYGESSLVLDGIAKTLYVTKRGAGTAFAWHTRRFKVNQKVVDPSFLNKALHGEKARQQIMAVATQTALTGITTVDFFRTEILLPSLPKQRKIARILSTVDEVIEKTEAAIDKYKAIKAGMMRDLFTRGIDLATGKLRPSYEEAPELYKNSKLGMVSKEWCQGEFIDFADKNISHSFTGGPFGSDLQTKHYTSSGVRIIQLQNIGDGVFNDEYKIYTNEEKANQLLNCNIYPGEIIISKMADPIARACIIPNSAKRFLMASDGIRLGIDKKKFNTRFVLETINDNRFRRIAELKSTGSTRARIGLTELRDIPIVYPEKKEQDIIGQQLDAIEILLKNENNYLEKIRQLKLALMSDLLTGKVRVNYEDEKAEVA